MAIPLTLTVFQGERAIACKRFERDIIKIGRLSSAHLCLEDQKVSRIHSVIEVVGEALSIVDMGSVEGTFVNGVRVTKGKLAFGDSIAVGSTVITVARAEAPSAAVAPPPPPPKEEPPQRVPRLPPRRRRSEGPLGVELRFLWGDQIVSEHFLRPGAPPRVNVGKKEGVVIVMGDRRLGGPSFELITVDANGATLHVTPAMTGEVLRAGQSQSLFEAEGLEREGARFVLPLGIDDFVWVDLGGIVVEIFFQPQPKPVFVPFSEGADFVVLNIFLACFFLGALFVISAANRSAEGEGQDDDFGARRLRVAKLLVKPQPPKAPTPAMERKSDPSAAKHAGDEGQAGRREAPARPARITTRGTPSKDQARALVAQLFAGEHGGLSSVLGHQALGNELNEAIGHVVGLAPGDARGLGGLGLLRGGLGGGGAAETLGARIGTHGRGGGEDPYGKGIALLGHKLAADYQIDPDPPEVVGALDRELIRRVIHANIGQIRYCYESQLGRAPTLAGKVAIRFIITPTGTVSTASVAQSTVSHAELEACVAGRVRTWQFPKPRGGGVVVVTYPFLFKQSGS